MRKQYFVLFIIVTALCVLPAFCLERITPVSMHGVEVELLPENAGTIMQSISCTESADASPEELAIQASLGEGNYSWLTDNANIGYWQNWDYSSSWGYVALYHSLLRYDTSIIPPDAFVIRAELVWNKPQSVLSNDILDFNILLGNCHFIGQLDEDSLVENFNIASNPTYTIDLGLSQSLSGQLFEILEITIPSCWIERNGYTDFSLISDSNEITVGEQRAIFPLQMSLLFGQPPTDYRPTLVVEYIEIKHK